MADTTKPQTKLPSQSGTEIGDSGTLMYKGFITNEEYNKDLVGTKGLQTYDIMRRSDATVHSVLTVCKNPIISSTHSIEPASDDDVDVEIAEFVERELLHRNINWPDMVRQGLTALDFGHAVFEKVFELTEYDGKVRIGLKKLAVRKQRTIQAWEMENGKPGIQQQLLNPAANHMATTVNIPREKLIYIVNEKEGDNETGISMLRFAYKPWKIKDALEIMNAIALERMAVGVPILRKNADGTDVNVSTTDLADARESLRQMRANEEAYLELPLGLDVEMLDMKAQSTKDILPTIEHQNTQITLSVLAQFLMLGSGQSASGSRAVSQDQTALFNKALEAVARMFQNAIQNDLIKQLVDLNYSDVKDYPKYVITGIADDDIQTISTAVSSLMTSGALTADPDVENRLRNMLGLPNMSDDAYENYEERKQPIDNPNDGKDTETNDGKKSPDAKKDAETDTKDLEKQSKDTKKQASQLIIEDARKAKARLFNALLEG